MMASPRGAGLLALPGAMCGEKTAEAPCSRAASQTSRQEGSGTVMRQGPVFLPRWPAHPQWTPGAGQSPRCLPPLRSAAAAAGARAPMPKLWSSRPGRTASTPCPRRENTGEYLRAAGQPAGAAGSPAEGRWMPRLTLAHPCLALGWPCCQPVACAPPAGHAVASSCTACCT